MTKIMLVEDDNNLREIYQARLAAEGFDIVSSSDGEAALAQAAKEKPDVIISDVMMPKISGFEMLDILRNTDGLKNVKVIMLTALGQAEDSQRANSLGADRYLVKSQVTLEDIVKATHELVGDAPEPAPAAAGSTDDATATDDVATDTQDEVTPSAPAPEAVVDPVAVAPEAVAEPTPATDAPVADAPVEPAPAPVAEPAAEPASFDVAPEPSVTPEPVATEPISQAPEPATVAPSPTDEPAEQIAVAPEPAVEPTQPASDVPVTPAPDNTTPELALPTPVAPDASAPKPVTTIPVMDAPSEPAPAPAPGSSVAPTVAPGLADVSPSTDPAFSTDATPTDAPAADGPAMATPPASDDALAVAADSQSTASEEASIKAQIDSFINSHDASQTAPAAIETPTTPEATVAPEAPEVTPVVAPTAPVVEPQPETPAPALSAAPVTVESVPVPDGVVEPEPEVMSSYAAPVISSSDGSPAPAPTPMPTPPAPAADPTAAHDDNLLADAAQNLTAAAPQPASDEAAQVTPDTGKPTKKVIEPLGPLEPKTDINQLLAVEEAKNAAGQAAAFTAPEATATPNVDAYTPITPPQPSSNSEIDPNSISL